MLQRFAFILSFIFHYFSSGEEDTPIFYKNSTNGDELQPISTTTTTTRRPFFQNARLPCSCYQRQCGCCTGVLLEAFSQKACMNFTYEPDDFSIGASMTFNGRILYKNTFSGKERFINYGLFPFYFIFRFEKNKIKKKKLKIQ